MELLNREIVGLRRTKRKLEMECKKNLGLIPDFEQGLDTSGPIVEGPSLRLRLTAVKKCHRVLEEAECRLSKLNAKTRMRRGHGSWPD